MEVELFAEGGGAAGVRFDRFDPGRWRRNVDPEQAFPGVGQRKSRDEEMWQLRRKLDRVTQERDILKKALGIVSDRR